MKFAQDPNYLKIGVNQGNSSFYAGINWSERVPLYFNPILEVFFGGKIIPDYRPEKFMILGQAPVWNLLIFNGLCSDFTLRYYTEYGTLVCFFLFVFKSIFCPFFFYFWI